MPMDDLDFTSHPDLPSYSSVERCGLVTCNTLSVCSIPKCPADIPEFPLLVTDPGSTKERRPTRWRSSFCGGLHSQSRCDVWNSPTGVRSRRQPRSRAVALTAKGTCRARRVRNLRHTAMDDPPVQLTNTNGWSGQEAERSPPART